MCIGGRVLRTEAVQEEILFLLYPESIITCLFVEELNDNESLSIKGVERYNNYLGYSYELEFNCNYEDKTGCDEFGRLETEVICMDALPFYSKDYFKQFEAEFILRELNKIIVGFFPSMQCNLINSEGIITGKWGCGVFGGNPVLKIIIQIIACGIVKRPYLKITTFQDKDLNYKFKPLLTYFQQVSYNPLQLLSKLLEFNDLLDQYELKPMSNPSNVGFIN